MRKSESRVKKRSFGKSIGKEMRIEIKKEMVDDIEKKKVMILRKGFRNVLWKNKRSFKVKGEMKVKKGNIKGEEIIIMKKGRIVEEKENGEDKVRGMFKKKKKIELKVGLKKEGIEENVVDEI